MDVLIINAGSSSLKYQLYNCDEEKVLAKGNCERIGIDGSFIKHKVPGKDDVVVNDVLKTHQDAVEGVLKLLVGKDTGVITDMKQIGAVGHRVLHGGDKYIASVLIDDDVKQAIRDCIPLGPLHNPANLMGIEACQAAMPGTPQVAVFDTAFHQTMPEVAYLYGLPYEYYEKYHVRRYGFHGTSHAFVSKRTLDILNMPAEGSKMITCHLGNGSSLAAVKDGKCADTSMGLTPLAGFLMGTRCGDIDPAIIKYLMDSGALKDIDEADFMMNKKSGVLGVSGISSDFRDICAAADQGNKRAVLALDMFGYQIKKFIGAYAAAMGGLDILVFTAGIGENTPEVRSRCCEGLEFLGVKLDPEKNEKNRGEGIISADDSKVKVLVVPTNEELYIVQDTLRIVGA